MPNISTSVTHNSLLSPTIIASVCPRQTKGVTCRHLLTSEDHSVALLQHNKLIWAREEALANIVAVEIIELPMSDRDQEIETEFDQKESKYYVHIIFIKTLQIRYKKKYNEVIIHHH